MEEIVIRIRVFPISDAVNRICPNSVPISVLRLLSKASSWLSWNSMKAVSRIIEMVCTP